jgi:L-fuconolactonase
MIIDAHQHFWKYDPVRDSWIDESMKVIRKDFLPEDLEPILKANNVDGCVAVQADQSENETEFLLKLAQHNSFIKGVVGWVDLCSNDIEKRLEYYSQYHLFKGVRHIVQAETEGFMLQNSFLNGINLLDKFNLTYDILILAHQLKEANTLVERFPNQAFVLDHLAKPLIKAGDIETWKKDITSLSKLPNVSCKLSGMVTEASWNNWTLESFKPYIETILENFGIDRVMFGSDWPVCLLSGSYKQVLEVLDYATQLLSNSEKNKLMGQNAINFYNLKP